MGSYNSQFKFIHIKILSISEDIKDIAVNGNYNSQHYNNLKRIPLNI